MRLMIILSFVFFNLGYSEIIKIDSIPNSHMFIIKNLTMNESAENIGIKAYNLNYFNSIFPGKVPKSFCLTSNVFYGVISPYHCDIKEIDELLKQYKKTPTSETKSLLLQKAKRFSALILEIQLPEDFLITLSELYATFSVGGKKSLIVRSSISSTVLNKAIPNTLEDYNLDIKHFSDLVYYIKLWWASIFNEQAMIFFLENKIDLEELAIGIIVQQKIEIYDKDYISYENGVINKQFLNKLNNQNVDQFINKLAKIINENNFEEVQIEYVIDKCGNIFLIQVDNLNHLISHKKQSFINNNYLKAYKNKSFARIALFGIVVNNDRVLFLKQELSPYYWRPPGGGLLKGEGLIEGLKREIKEDTSLDVDVLRLVEVWKGIHGIDNTVLSLLYLCNAKESKIKLSSEFSEYMWISMDDLLNCSFDTAFDIGSWKKYFTEYKIINNIKDNK